MADKPKYAPRDRFAGRGGTETPDAPDFAATTLEPPRFAPPPAEPHPTQPVAGPQVVLPTAEVPQRSYLIYGVLFLTAFVVVSAIGIAVGILVSLL